MGDFIRDLHFGLRSFAKRPGFTSIVIVTIGLGIGATATIFSLVNGILLQPLSYRDADRLVAIWPEQWQTKPLFQLLEESASSYEALAGWTPRGHVFLAEDGAERLLGPKVTARFFDVLGRDLAVGRTFAEEEDRRRANVVVISYGLWQQRFGGDPEVIGQSIRLRGADRTIIGVMSRGYNFLQRDADLAIPHLMESDAPGWGYKELKGITGRLKPGISIEQADAELQALTSRWREEYDLPDDWGVGARLVPLRDSLVGDVRPTLLLLFGAVGLTFLIATANVANLLLARAFSRQREISLRLALGAKPSRLIRQLLAETTLLGVLGGALGLGVAVLGLRGVLALLPPETPRLIEVGVDGFVLGFSLLLALIAGWIVGLTPALHTARTDLRESLAGSGRGATEIRSRRQLRSGIVMAEIALAVLLLSGSGLLFKSFHRIMQIDPGFRPAGVFTFVLVPVGGGLDSPAELHAFYRVVSERLAAIPGVSSVAEINAAPFAPDGWITGLFAEERPPPAGTNPPIARWRPVTPGYFGTAGVPLLEGRLLTEIDLAEGAQVAVISKSAANELFAGEDALGGRIVVGLEQNEPVTIVGVVSEVKALGLDQESPATVYRPYSQVDEAIQQLGGSARTVVLRTDGNPEGLAAQVRDAVRSVDRYVLIQDFQSMADAISDSLSRRRVTMILLSLFTATALVLGAIGIYGVMSYTVGERAKELAIRVALGASGGMVLRDVLLSGLKIAATGTAVGIGLALALSRALERFVFEIDTLDPWVLTSAVSLSIVVAVLASYWPARRAGVADPMQVLSGE